MSNLCTDCQQPAELQLGCHQLCHGCGRQVLAIRLQALVGTLHKNPSGATGVFDLRCHCKSLFSLRMPHDFARSAIEEILQTVGGLDTLNSFYSIFQDYFLGKFTYFLKCHSCSCVIGSYRRNVLMCWKCNTPNALPDRLQLKQQLSMDLLQEQADFEHRMKALRVPPAIHQYSDSSTDIFSQVQQYPNMISQSVRLISDQKQSAGSHIADIGEWLRKCLSDQVGPVFRSVSTVVVFTDQDDWNFYGRVIHSTLVFIEPIAEKLTTVIKVRQPNTSMFVIEVPCEPEATNLSIVTQGNSIQFKSTADYLLRYRIVFE